MRTAYVLVMVAMLAAGDPSRALAQVPQPDPHHPAAAGGPASPPGPPSPAPGAGMMSPDMARMMPMMMKGMCAMMMGGDQGMMTGGPGGGMAMGRPSDPVTGAFEAINRRMHRDMMVDASGSADRAFAEAMIAHHQGAIDMAKVVLAFGSDARIRTLAEQVIKAQEGEIAVLRQWLADQPQP